MALAALAATPALALSTTVRQLVGIDAKRSPAPALEARITGVTVHRRPVGAIMTVTFTVGEPGKAPGTGIPDGSSFLVLLVPKRGGTPLFAKAEGSNGRYRVTHWVPRGGLKLVQVGGWLNRRPVTAAGGFFIPITVVNHPY